MPIKRTSADAPAEKEAGLTAELHATERRLRWQIPLITAALIVVILAVYEFIV